MLKKSAYLIIIIITIIIVIVVAVDGLVLARSVSLLATRLSPFRLH